MRKAQISLEKILLIVIIVASAIIVSYFLYKSTYTNLSNIGVKSYLEYISFGNIYANKESVFLLLSNKTNIGNNIIINEKITFSNGTSNTINIPFILSMLSPSQNGYLYYLTTTDFPQISNSSQSIKVSNINIFNDNSVIESTNTSTNYTSYYYTESSLSTLPLYYLNLTSSILNGGILNPGNGYYYAGSKVAISEKPNPGFSFNGWIGSGKGNYTGPNQASVITMNSNITESAQFVKLVKMYVNSTYNGINVYVDGVLNTTTNGIVYFVPGTKYTLSFPMYVKISNGVRYVFENMQDSCGIPISTNSNSTTFISTYANYNCKFTANYVEQYLLLVNFDSFEGSASPSGGWYNSESDVEISVTPKYGYAFSKVSGSGSGNYTGNNNPFYVVMGSPITENVEFVPMVLVYVLSSAQSVPYSFKSNDNTIYNGITNNSFMAPLGATLTLEGYKQINWGERIITNIKNSTCQLLNQSITLPTNSEASCTVYLNPPTTQYLFIVNEFLDGSNESNNLKYGSVYIITNVTNKTKMTSNQTWINAGTNVSFYATNDKAGYAFKNFTGTNSILNGVSYSGVSGIDSVPGKSVGYCLLDAGLWWNSYYDSDESNYNPIYIIMNSPVIENANYYLTRNITGNTVSVNVNYKYYNITQLYTYNHHSGLGYTYLSSVTASKINLLNSGTETITIHNVTPYSNYSSGIGEENLLHLNSFIYYYNQYTIGNYYSISNFTSKQLYYMPQEYNYVINQVVSNIENQYPPKFIYYNNSISYIINLQLSFNLSGTQVYIHYVDTPTSTIYSDSPSHESDYTVWSYFGYSNYYLSYYPNLGNSCIYFFTT